MIVGIYERMVSTPIYYQVCKDLIEEAYEMFDHPEFIHIGMDEEEHIKATYSQEEIDNLDGFVACPWVMMDPDKEEVIIEQIELLGKAKAYFYSK